MSKITFRADDDLVDAVEALDASKSEIMRNALRAYLEGHAENSPEAVGHSVAEESLDQIVTRRVDELLEERLHDDHQSNHDVHVYVDVDGSDAISSTTDRSPAPGTADKPPASGSSTHRSGTEPSQQTCAQCGINLDPDHVYCPNCGEHATPTFHCECGEVLQPDWSFCPACGRRTASTEYLER